MEQNYNSVYPERGLKHLNERCLISSTQLTESLFVQKHLCESKMSNCQITKDPEHQRLKMSEMCGLARVRGNRHFHILLEGG